MSKATALLLILTCSMTVVMILRVFGDWFTIKDVIADGSIDEQEKLSADLHVWQSRHLTGAGLALLLLTAIGNLPGLKALHDVYGVLAAYAGISLSFAVVEMLMLQKLAVVRVRIGK
jgi:hypothetical protein